MLGYNLQLDLVRSKEAEKSIQNVNAADGTFELSLTTLIDITHTLNLLWAAEVTRTTIPDSACSSLIVTPKK